jgi:hypothetical protein
MFGDRLPVAPVAPGDAPLIANALGERLFAALGQLRPCRSAKPTPKCSPRTDPPRSRDDHECVSVRNQEVVVDIIAVDDPPLACEQVPLCLDQFVVRHSDPAGPPPVKVKMDQRKAGLRSQLARKRALSSTCHASDDDATLHGAGVWAGSRTRASTPPVLPVMTTRYRLSWSRQASRPPAARPRVNNTRVV